MTPKMVKRETEKNQESCSHILKWYFKNAQDCDKMKQKKSNTLQSHLEMVFQNCVRHNNKQRHVKQDSIRNLSKKMVCGTGVLEKVGKNAL